MLRFVFVAFLFFFLRGYALDSMPRWSLTTATYITWRLNYWVAYRCIEQLHFQAIHVSLFLREDYKRVYLKTFSKSTYFSKWK
jgi:hypothetical protein